MKYTFLIVLLSSHFVFAKCPDWLNHDMQKLHSKETVNLCTISEGKTLLLVNTASQCGFRPQFKGLEALNKKYKDQGLVIIGFPSNNFFQEHKDSAKTAKVCYINYGVTFLMLESSAVRGSNANPIFKHLGDTLGTPSWNFNKYLINKEGIAVKKFGSFTKPNDKVLITAIEQLLAEPKK